MTLFIEVANGPYSGKCVALSPGETAIVGRSGQCKLSLPDDALLFNRQLAIVNTGFGFQVSNLKPVREMKFDGVAQTSIVSSSGGKLRCGRSELLLYTPDTQFSPSESPIMRLAEHLSSTEPGLYLMFTPVDSAEAPSALEEFGLHLTPIFEGERQEVLAELAPYLVKVPLDTTIIGRLLLCTWGRACSAWLSTPLALPEIRATWRKLAMVHDGEEHIYFRFYDPRVLQALLIGSNDEERWSLFSEMDSIYLEGRKSHSVNHWRIRASQSTLHPFTIGTPWRVDLIQDWATFLAPLHPSRA